MIRNRTHSRVTATSLVLAGPKGWRAAIEQVVSNISSLAIVAGVECNVNEVDIRAIEHGDVVLIAVDGNEPYYAIEFALQMQAKDRGTSIALVLPNMSEMNLRKLGTYGGSWSMISAVACIDTARLGAVLGSAARGISWVDPIITRLLKTFDYGTEDFDIDVENSAIDDFVLQVTRPADSAKQQHPCGKILVVDDNDGIRLALELILEEDGHEVITASDGSDGVNLAKSTIPDLILLDVMMPVMDGFEALMKLKALPETSHIPVIMVTAKGGSSDLDKARELGALDYITKPWVEGEVEASVAWALSRVAETT